MLDSWAILEASLRPCRALGEQRPQQVGQWAGTPPGWWRLGQGKVLPSSWAVSECVWGSASYRGQRACSWAAVPQSLCPSACSVAEAPLAGCDPRRLGVFRWGASTQEEGGERLRKSGSPDSPAPGGGGNRARGGGASAPTSSPQPAPLFPCPLPCPHFWTCEAGGKPVALKVKVKHLLSKRGLPFLLVLSEAGAPHTQVAAASVPLKGGSA